MPSNEQDLARAELTPLQMQGAALLATGARAEKVAEVLDVHTNTVYNWRKIEAFNKEVSFRAKEAADRLGALAVDARTGVIELNHEILDVMKEAITATTNSGKPDWDTRIKVIEIAHKYGIGLPSSNGKGSGGGGGNNNAAVLVINKDDLAEAFQGNKPEPPKSSNIIEAEVVDNDDA